MQHQSLISHEQMSKAHGASSSGHLPEMRGEEASMLTLVVFVRRAGVCTGLDVRWTLSADCGASLGYRGLLSGVCSGLLQGCVCVRCGVWQGRQNETVAQTQQ